MDGMDRVAKLMEDGAGDGGSSIAGALAMALQNIPSCQAAALVDIGASQLLGLQMAEGLALAQPELTGPVINELFQGAAASCIATMWRPVRAGEPVAAGFGNIIIQAPDLLQIYLRLPNIPDYAVLFAWSEAPSLGIALSKAHAALAVIESALV